MSCAAQTLFKSVVELLTFTHPPGSQVYMEPLKQVQVEGYLMVAEPELLFGNLDELCCVSTKRFRKRRLPNPAAMPQC